MNPHFKNRGEFILFFSILVILSLVLGFVYSFNYSLNPVDSEATLELKVSKGQGLKEIAAALSQAGLIKSITVFKFYVIFAGKAQNLKPGVYQFNGRMSVPEMVNLLIKGSNEEINVTIPEGTTVKEIDRILSSKNIIVPGSLIAFDFEYKRVDNLEGFLYPDTYRFKINSSVEEVITKLLNNFQEKIWPLISEKNNWYEILIFASILEKEVPNFNDQQLIAGILNKRLLAGMPLQVDATIVYAKCQGDLLNCPQRQVIKNDLKIDSPYNTYLNLGLPPTPIANFPQDTVQAVLNPEPSNYWYYLSAKQTKETIFSKTLSEHNKNRQQYLKLQ